MTYFDNRMSEPRIKDLFDMLMFCRPAGSKTERKFINKFLKPLGFRPDRAGNMILVKGDAPILWSAHSDTVHKMGGSQVIATDKNEVALAQVAKSNCLGADNTAGVWLLLELLKAGKEGIYIVHRGEEIGGKGSAFLVKNSPEIVSGVKAAIAFDRRGTESIITHQRGGRKCSDTFAKSLSAGLNLKHKLDTGGTFTDTANYSDLIGECTNVSVGFSSEHTEYERLDVEYLEQLREALLALDTSKLEFERKPGEVEPKPNYYSFPSMYPAYKDRQRSYGGYAGYGNWAGSEWAGEEWDYPAASPSPAVEDVTRKEYDLTKGEFGDLIDRITEKNRDLDMASICRMYPAHVADFLEQMGIDEEDLIDHIARIETNPQNFK